MTKYADPVAAFWQKVKVGAPDECWPWQRTCKPGGYGNVYWHPYRARCGAHRIAYEIANGVAPTGQQVRHTCDNPPCCNPKHLLLGSPADNARDKVDRGRCPRGVNASNVKINPDIVREIRLRRLAGESRPALAKIYGLNPTSLFNLERGITWAHVDNPGPVFVGRRAAA